MAKRLVLLAAAACLLSSCLGDSHKCRQWHEIRKSGVLHVVTEYSPNGYYWGKDSIEGFQTELINAFARSHGLRAEITAEQDAAKQKKGLTEGRYDIIAHNLLITLGEVQDSSLLFTHPIDTSSLVLVQRTREASPDDYVSSVLDLGGKKVTVPERSPYMMRLRNLQKEIGDTIAISQMPLYGPEQLIYLVSHGDIERTVADYPVAERLGKDLGNIDFSQKISFSLLYAWAVDKKSVELLDSLNSWIDSYSRTDAFLSLRKRYLGH